MTQTATTSESAVRAYARLLRQLHSLIANRADESPDGDSIRDEMDSLWHAMSTAECDRMSGLSEDLHALNEGKDRRVRMDANARREWEQDFQSSTAKNDFDRVLALLRRPPDDIPIARVCEHARDCWEKLGDSETAGALGEGSQAAN